MNAAFVPPSPSDDIRKPQNNLLCVIKDMNKIDSFKKKLRRPIPLRGFERKLYAVVLLSIASGITWSVSAHDWQYFERSGSLVIVAAVTMAWRDHVHLLGEVKRFYQGEFQRLLAELDERRPAGIVGTVVHDAKIEKIRTKYSNFDELIAMLTQRLRTTEATILCLGTFIWGYGSIIGNLFWSFN